MSVSPFTPEQIEPSIDAIAEIVGRMSSGDRPSRRDKAIADVIAKRAEETFYGSAIMKRSQYSYLSDYCRAIVQA